MEFLKGRGRMIFALLGGIIFLVVKAFMPEFPIGENETIAFIILLGAYILGEGISGRTFGDNLFTMLRSQKFQALIAGVAVILVKEYVPSLNIGETELLALIGAIMAFIVGSGAQPELPELYEYVEFEDEMRDEFEDGENVSDRVLIEK